jgi:hypothetical protein
MLIASRHKSESGSMSTASVPSLSARLSVIRIAHRAVVSGAPAPAGDEGYSEAEPHARQHRARSPALAMAYARRDRRERRLCRGTRRRLLSASHDVASGRPEVIWTVSTLRM